MEKTFETEVLTRLAVIESKLDGYQNIKEKAEESYTISKQNKEDIKEPYNEKEVKKIKYKEI